MKLKRMVLGVLLAGGISAEALAAPTIVKPSETGSNDVFVYQFLGAFNFETSGPGFQKLLAVANTGDGGHDVRTLINFNMSGVTLEVGEIATLHLHVIDTASAGFGFSPTPAMNPRVDVSFANSSWVESTVTWGSVPAVGSLVATATADGINKELVFDVTGAVSDWLGGATNNGFELTQRDFFPVGATSAVAVVFDSASGTNQPYLQIAAVPVPEPASLGLLGLGALALCGRRSLRKA